MGELTLSTEDYFKQSPEPLNEVSPVNGETSTPVVSDDSLNLSSEDYFKDVAYQAKFNEPIIPKPETKENEPSNFWMGFDEQKIRRSKLGTSIRK